MLSVVCVMSVVCECVVYVCCCVVGRLCMCVCPSRYIGLKSKSWPFSPFSRFFNI